MTPLANIIAGLRRNQLDLKFALEREVRVAMEGAAKLAQSFIGNEQLGWDPLKPATIADKARAGYEVPKPLLRTGELRVSIKGEAEAVPGGVVGVVGTDDPTAIWHELGTSRMPARPFLGPVLILSEPAIVAALGALAVRTLTPGTRP